MQRYTDLNVWQRAFDLVIAIYRQTDEFPRSEQFGITDQARRAAVSVLSNIAEGSKRVGRADYARFLNIAEGSLAETESLLRVSVGLHYLAAETAEGLYPDIDHIARMLANLRKAVLRVARRRPSPLDA